MNSEKNPVIYVGYDSRENLAYEVLRESILRYTNKYDIIPLVQTSLRRAGLYRRTIRLDIETGSPARVDEFDCRPFSTDFTFTRFLIPALNQYSGWALFMDSDMFLRTNIEELFEEYTQNEQYAIQCVHHNYNPTASIKMDGQVQQNYNRKNWSSFVLWNCSHKANLNLTVDDANLKTGGWLHGFGWLEDEHIGSISEDWNWLDGWSSEKIDAKNVHFTTGGPWFNEWEPKRDIDATYAGEWKKLKANMIFDKEFGKVI